MTNKIPREQTEFVTPEGLLNFLSLFPGQAVDSMQPGSKSYKFEMGLSPQALQAEPSLISALSIVAQANAGTNWETHVWSKLRTLDQMPGRDRAKYEYYEGLHVLSLSSIVSPATLKMKDVNLAIPEQRMRYDAAVAAAAPGAHKFCNPNNPADLAKIELMNHERVMRGLTAIPEAEYFRTTIPLAAHEIWSGCYGRVKGRVYWSANQKPQALGIAFSFVLFTKEGERLVGESSADAAFSNFAPPASLAPQAPPVPAGVLQFPGMPAAPVMQPAAPPAGFNLAAFMPPKDPFAGLA